ncbi:MAG: DHHA1 domain-containing protein [Patescibacteria group bacterium]
MKNIVVIYHNDEDGFAGAWVAWKKFKNKAKYIAAGYSNPPKNNFKNKEIYLIDFCFNSAESMKKLLKNNKKVIVVDHHISAKKLVEISTENCFDINHSGCVLAWKYFFPKKSVPKLLQHIEDMDLWKFKKKNTREIIASLDTYEFKFSIWNKVVKALENHSSTKKYIDEGRAIVKYQDTLIKKLADGGIEVKLDKKRAVSVNSPILISEIGNYIYSKKGKIGLVWSSENGKVRVSLRSQKGVDVSKIAKNYGGGGHKQASGFSFDYKFDFPWKPIKK